MKIQFTETMVWSG